jgi:hypothetical protein
MLTVEERALATDMADRLIELYVYRDRARALDDWSRVRELQVEIDQVAAERQDLLDGGEATKRCFRDGENSRPIGTTPRARRPSSITSP